MTRGNHYFNDNNLFHKERKEEYECKRKSDGLEKQVTRPSHVKRYCCIRSHYYRNSDYLPIKEKEISDKSLKTLITWHFSN